jgi:hypothetical protein
VYTGIEKCTGAINEDGNGAFGAYHHRALHFFDRPRFACLYHSAQRNKGGYRSVFIF